MLLTVFYIPHQFPNNNNNSSGTNQIIS